MILVRYCFNAVIKIKAIILNHSFKLLLVVHTIANTALILNATFLLFNFFFLSSRKLGWCSYYKCRNYSSVFKLCTLTLVWWGYNCTSISKCKYVIIWNMIFFYLVCTRKSTLVFFIKVFGSTFTLSNWTFKSFPIHVEFL